MTARKLFVDDVLQFHLVTGIPLKEVELVKLIKQNR